MAKTIKLFWGLIAAFVFLAAALFIPALRNLFKGSVLFLLPFAAFFSFGLALFIAAVKSGGKSKLRTYLILSGLSASGVFVSILLHNAFYALSSMTAHIALVGYLVKAIEILFFIAAVLAFPILFLVGTAGAISTIVRSKGGT